MPTGPDQARSPMPGMTAFAATASGLNESFTAFTRLTEKCQAVMAPTMAAVDKCQAVMAPTMAAVDKCQAVMAPTMAAVDKCQAVMAPTRALAKLAGVMAKLAGILEARAQSLDAIGRGLAALLVRRLRALARRCRARRLLLLAFVDRVPVDVGPPEHDPLALHLGLSPPALVPNLGPGASVAA